MSVRILSYRDSILTDLRSINSTLHFLICSLISLFADSTLKISSVALLYFAFKSRWMAWRPLSLASNYKRRLTSASWFFVIKAISSLNFWKAIVSSYICLLIFVFYLIKSTFSIYNFSSLAFKRSWTSLNSFSCCSISARCSACIFPTNI